MGFYRKSNEKQSNYSKIYNDNHDPEFVNIISEKNNEEVETLNTLKSNKLENNSDILNQELEKKNILAFCKEPIDKSNFFNARKSYLYKSIEDISMLEQEYYSKNNKIENDLFENNKNYIPISESPLNTISEVIESDSTEDSIKMKINELKFEPSTSANFSKVLLKPLTSSSCSATSSNVSLSTIEDDKSLINQDKNTFSFLSRLSLTQNSIIDITKNNNSNEKSVLTTILTASKVEKPSMTMMQTTSFIVKSARFSRRSSENTLSTLPNALRYVSLQNSQPSLLDESYDKIVAFNEVKNDVTSSDLSSIKTNSICNKNKTIAFLPFSNSSVEFPTTIAQQPLRDINSIDLNIKINNLSENNLELLKQFPVDVQSICNKPLIKKLDYNTIQNLQNNLLTAKDIADNYKLSNQIKNSQNFFGSSKALIRKRKSFSSILSINDLQHNDFVNFTTKNFFAKPLKNSLLDLEKKKLFDYTLDNSCNLNFSKYNDDKTDKIRDEKNIKENYLNNTLSNDQTTRIKQIKNSAPTSTISYIKSLFNRRTSENTISLSTFNKNFEKNFYPIKKLSINSLISNYDNIITKKKIDDQLKSDSDSNYFKNRKKTLHKSHSSNVLYNHKIKSNYNSGELKSIFNIKNVKLAREESFFSDNEDITLYNNYSTGK